MNKENLQKILETEVFFGTAEMFGRVGPVVPMLELIHLYCEYLKERKQEYKMREAYNSTDDARDIKNEITVFASLYGSDRVPGNAFYKKVEREMYLKMMLSEKTQHYPEKHYQRVNTCEHDINFLNESYMAFGYVTSNHYFIDRNLVEYLYGIGSISGIDGDVVRFKDVLPCMRILGPMLYHVARVFVFNNICGGKHQEEGIHAFMPEMLFNFNQSESKELNKVFWYVDTNGDRINPSINESTVHELNKDITRALLKIPGYENAFPHEVPKEVAMKSEEVVELYKDMSNFEKRIQDDPYFTTNIPMKELLRYSTMKNMEDWAKRNRLIMKGGINPYEHINGFVPFMQQVYVGVYKMAVLNDENDEESGYSFLRGIGSMTRSRLEKSMEELYQYFDQREMTIEETRENMLSVMMLNHFIDGDDDTAEEMAAAYVRLEHEFQYVSIVQETPLNEHIAWHMVTRVKTPHVPKVN